MAELRLEAMGVSLAGRALVRNVSFTLRPGQLIALLGPNGAGKTSLLRAALGILPTSAGKAYLNGRETRLLSARERALQIAYLPQQRPLAWPNRVRDLVALGRFAHGVALGRLADADAEAVARALADAELTHLADRPVTALSGGEMARVHCARMLAANAPLLLADEPEAALDLRHQHQVMTLIRRFVDRGGGALTVLHDVNLAARFANRLLWMRAGELVADGPPSETLNADVLARVYQVQARVRSGFVEVDAPLQVDKARS